MIRFLEENEVSKDLVVVAHELTPSSKAALYEGTFDALISQDTGHLVRSAVRLLKATADRVPFNPTQERIRIDIYLKENMPAGVVVGAEGRTDMKTIKGPALFLAQFAGDEAPFNSWDGNHQMGGRLRL